MTKTSNQYRAEARDAEKALDWGRAAHLWDMAVETYPNPRGQLAQRDISIMVSKKLACRRMEESEAKHQANAYDFNSVYSPLHY